ncbi:jouberin-like isoform X2 [Watersipora subatra]|uniref:jouberin-like isoform X2 n=1 Tax=Watersipora subatra TaxID=2589382 RepID=UPI00355C42AB
MDAAGEESLLTTKTDKKKIKKKKSVPKREDAEDPKDNLVATDSIKKSTKATFDLYLEQAQANIVRDRKASPKKGKSRRKKESEEVLLENLRNSREFRKDTDEETKKRNTYDPDESKEKSNRKRDKPRKKSAKSGSTQGLVSRTEGNENIAFDSGERDEAPHDNPMTIDELTKPTKSKKKVKKERKRSEEETSFIEQTEKISSEGKEKKLKKRKGKEAEESAAEDVEEKPIGRFEYTDENKIAGVVVHRAEKLRTNDVIEHPLVRVHLIDADTGHHLQKQDKERAVTSFYETKKRDETLETILPIMTQAFDFKDMRTVVPWWDEMLVFNEPFNGLVQEKPNVIMFFEVLDFVSMNRALKNKYSKNVIKGEEGWHKEAWAFLKLRGVNGKLNVDKQVRLQLYEVPVSRVVTDEVPVYQYWKYCVRRNYPSSLYVTVKSLLPPDVIVPTARSMFPTQAEQGTMSDKQFLDRDSRSHTKETSEDAPSKWSKLPGQMCRLPNSMLLNLPAGKMGCLVLAFSNDGRYLACGCHDKTAYPILIYEIPGGQLTATLTGHYNNVYALSWSRADKYLLSASSDGTARVWEVVNKKCLKLLPHPTFVYCAKFHPRVSKVVVTGSYDNILRVWHIDGADNIQADLQQELEGHDSYINSLCFDEEGNKLFTADNIGTIKIWNVNVTEKATKKGITRDWTLNSTVVNEEFKDQRISYIMVHPNGRRLLVQTKDNTIRMLDLRMETVTQRYIGALNFREIVHSDITICGTFVFSGSEDGCAYVWNTETGDQVAVYSDLHYPQTVNDVKFHPLDHIVAFCSRGDNQKVQVFKYDFNWIGKENQSKYTLVSQSHLTAGRNSALPSDDEMTVQKEEKSLQIDAKKNRAMKKLESVMAFSRGVNKQQRQPDAGFLSTSPPGTVDMTETWGSTFDMSYAQPTMTGLGPTIMSPHAPKTGEIEARRSHLTSQMQYMKKGSSQGWRPGFSHIGSRGDLPPPINMTMTSQGNQGGGLTLQGIDDIKPKGEVVALYDYLAQRSDELSFHKDDIILLLYEDTEHWWMGALKHTGAQGFIPSNYVERIDGMHHASKSPAASTSKGHTAVMHKGELKIISGTESDASSEDNLSSTGKRRRKRRGTKSRTGAKHTEAGSLAFDQLLQ